MNDSLDRTMTVVVARSKSLCLEGDDPSRPAVFIMGYIEGSIDDDIAPEKLMMAISPYHSISERDDLRPGGLDNWERVAAVETNAEVVAEIKKKEIFPSSELARYITCGTEIVNTFCQEMSYNERVLLYECNTPYTLGEFDLAMMQVVSTKIARESNYSQVHWEIVNRLIAGRLRTAIKLVEAELRYPSFSQVRSRDYQ